MLKIKDKNDLNATCSFCIIFLKLFGTISVAPCSKLFLYKTVIKSPNQQHFMSDNAKKTNKIIKENCY